MKFFDFFFKQSPPPKVVNNSLDPFRNGMAHIPSGSFDMGDTFGEGMKSELPVHAVTVYSFYLSKFPVTLGQWEQIIGVTSKSFQKNKALPAGSVSWDETKAFIAKLNSITGRAYRLPSEAEWEFAAREGGKKIRFGNGKNIANPTEMNFNPTLKDSYSLAGIYRQEAVAVDTFPPNSLGLYDMCGNLFEWCEDVWHNTYEGAPNDSAAWIDDGDQSKRVIRGGCVAYSASGCRATVRDRGPRGGGGYTSGFRIAHDYPM